MRVSLIVLNAWSRVFTDKPFFGTDSESPTAMKSYVTLAAFVAVAFWESGDVFFASPFPADLVESLFFGIWIFEDVGWVDGVSLGDWGSDFPPDKFGFLRGVCFSFSRLVVTEFRGW